MELVRKNLGNDKNYKTLVIGHWSLVIWKLPSSPPCSLLPAPLPLSPAIAYVLVTCDILSLNPPDDVLRQPAYDRVNLQLHLRSHPPHHP